MAVESGSVRSDRQEKLPFALQQDEQVLVVARRHWMFLWPRTILWTLFAIAPVAVFWWLLFSVGDVEGTGATIFWGVAAIWLVFWAGRIFLNWYQYDNDLWVVTNQRIVDSLKPTPFSLKISTADLVNIQDMTVEKRGILQSMLDYGDVACQTAGDRKIFLIGGVPKPQDLQLLIDRERDRERMRARGA